MGDRENRGGCAAHLLFSDSTGAKSTAADDVYIVMHSEI